jgi:hypothetical protein
VCEVEVMDEVVLPAVAIPCALVARGDFLSPW